jgi:hypothetical protein
MKKLLLVLTVGAFLAACGDGTSTKTDVTTDTVSTTVHTDSAMAPAVTDTTTKMVTDSAHSKMSADTTKK